MKKVRRGLAAALLLLTMTTAVFADGQLETGKNPPPSGATGQIDAPPVVIPIETVTVDTLADFALDIWLFMPSLF